MPGQRPLRLHLCTPTPDQLSLFTALRRWLLQAGHTILSDSISPLEHKLHAAADCDVCLLLLGPTFGQCAPRSSFSDTELEASTATDIHPGKLLVFAQDSITQPTSPEQSEFIERQRHFVRGSFSGTFRTPEELIGQVSEALAAWRPPEPHVPPQPLAVQPDSVMISSVTTLAPAREAVRRMLAEQQIPVIDFLHAPGEAATPIDRVISWARECRALLLILGERYGYISPVDGLGVTELEFVTALRAGRPIFAFLDSEAQALAETPEAELAQDWGAGKSRVDDNQWQFIQRVHALAPVGQIFRFTTISELEGCVREALALLARGLPTPPLVNVPVETQRRWYHRQLRRWLGVLPHLTQPQGMPLEDVYVSLQALPQAQLKSEQSEQEKREAERPAAGEAAPEHVFARGDSGGDRDEEKQATPEPPKPITVDEALQRYPRFVLRGNPGAGKSVALRWYAISAPEDVTPVFLRLAAYARTRQQKSDLGQPYPLLEAVAEEEARLALNGKADSFRWPEALRAGEGLVLLDAFDEVAGSQQAEIAGEIRALADQLPDTTRIVVTSRIVGFSTQLGPRFTVTEVQPLQGAQQRQLVELWLRAAHRDAEGEHDIARARAERLVTFLEGEKRLAEWAQTPLLLTFLAALVDAPGAETQRLPTTKAVIYRRVMRLLLGRWRTLTLRRSGDYLWLKETLLVVLAHGGILEGHGDVITSSAFATAWNGIMAGLSIPDGMRAPTASELQEMLSVQDGLLIRVGEGLYSFFHPTFQEYLAAALLATSGAATYLALVAQRRLSNRWEEVTQLLVSELDRLGNGQAADAVIRRLLKWDQQKVPLLGARDPLHLALARAARSHGVRDAVLANARTHSMLLMRWQQIERQMYKQRDAIEEYLATLGREMLIVLEGTSLRLPGLQRRLRVRLEEIRQEAISDLLALGPAAATPGGLAALGRALADPDERVRMTAAAALRQLEPTVAAATLEALAALVGRLADRNGAVRWYAARALREVVLRQLRPPAASATPEVIAALVSRLTDREEDRSVRQAAAEALGWLGPTAATPEVIAALVSRLADRHEDEAVRQAAAEALGWLGPTATPDVVAALVSRLADRGEDKAVWWYAAMALGRLGPAAAAATPDAVAALVSRLTDRGEDEDVRCYAAEALGWLGPAADAAAATPEVVAALVGRLTDRQEDKSVRRVAAAALGRLGSASAAATPAVLAALVGRLADREEDETIRAAAATALGELGSTVAVAAPAVHAVLTSRLADGNRAVHLAAAMAHLRLGFDAAATPALVTLLADQNQDETVRAAAAEALGRLGPAAATPAVLAVVGGRMRDREEDETVQRAAALALRKLEPTAATPAVLAGEVSRLTDQEWAVRAGAAAVLGRLGPAAATPAVLAALVGRLADMHVYVRRSAAAALGQLGPTAATPDVVAALVGRLADVHPDVRRGAAAAVGQLGPTAATPAVLAALGSRLGDREEGKDIREAAAAALERLKSAAAAATPNVVAALVDRLADRNEGTGVRQGAAAALGCLGPAAATPAVLAALVGRLGDRNEAKIVRRSVAAALGKLGPIAATPDVVTALGSRLGDRDEDEMVREAAAEALGRLGSAAATSDVVAALMRRLGDRNGRVRNAAAGALEQIGSLPHRSLVKGLRSLNRGKREACASLLVRTVPTIQDATAPGGPKSSHVPGELMILEEIVQREELPWRRK